jgi:hypothetical protein
MIYGFLQKLDLKMIAFYSTKTFHALVLKSFPHNYKQDKIEGKVKAKGTHHKHGNHFQLSYTTLCIIVGA